MFVHTLDDVEAAGRLKVQWSGTTRSARYLTAADGMGFSLHDADGALEPTGPPGYQDACSAVRHPSTGATSSCAEDSRFGEDSDYPIRQPVPPSTGSATPVTKRASSDAR